MRTLGAPRTACGAGPCRYTLEKPRPSQEHARPHGWATPQGKGLPSSTADGIPWRTLCSRVPNVRRPGHQAQHARAHAGACAHIEDGSAASSGVEEGAFGLIVPESILSARSFPIPNLGPCDFKRTIFRSSIRHHRVDQRNSASHTGINCGFAHISRQIPPTRRYCF